MQAFRIFVIAAIALIFVANLVLLGACVASGDKNSMACWLISERIEVGIQQR